MKLNPLTAIDFYKADHRRQYPEGTEYVYSNFTPRSSRHANLMKGYDNKVVFFGLQGFIRSFLMDTWNTEFFLKDKTEVVRKYKRRMDTSLGPDAIDVSHIEALHDLGFLPIEIKAAPEGSRVNVGVPVFTIENTRPEFFWLTNYLETVLSAEVWKACTTATIAYEYRKLMEQYAEQTGSPKDFIQFQCHDFSMRGMGGLADAAKNGAGHLLSFTGTDTVPAIDYLEDYYYADAEKELIGTSVPATEHSVMCMGTQEDEIQTFRRLITELYPTGIVSIVSDTWDFWKVITEYLPVLKPEIMARQPNALGMNKVVIRPDSGDPVDIVCGKSRTFDSLEVAINTINGEHWFEAENDCEGSFNVGAEEYETIVLVGEQAYKLTTPFEYNRHDKQFYFLDCWGEKGITTAEECEATAEMKGAVQCLWETFGGTETEQGYKVLDQHIGLIYGDSITLERADQILSRLKDKGFASCNIVFGVGSYTYQYNTRDTFGFAMKATYGVVNGESRDIFKDPVTDSGDKKSAKGLLCVSEDNGEFAVKHSCTKEELQDSVLQTVFKNGELTVQQTLSEIRKRVLL